MAAHSLHLSSTQASCLWAVLDFLSLRWQRAVNPNPGFKTTLKILSDVTNGTSMFLLNSSGAGVDRGSPQCLDGFLLYCSPELLLKFGELRFGVTCTLSQCSFNVYFFLTTSHCFGPTLNLTASCSSSNAQVLYKTG